MSGRLRESLLQLFAEPQRVDTDRQLWQAAAVLGGLRQAANDTIRALHRDRGEQKNAAGDLQGCLGELLVGILVEQHLEDDAEIICAGLTWAGPGDDVDVTVRAGSDILLLETKCHLHTPRKRRFLVNAVAAERSQERGARSFIPVLSTASAAVAIVGRPILIRDVRAWPVARFQYGDPAHSAPLEEITEHYFDLQFEAAVARIDTSARVVGVEALSSFAAVARSRAAELRADMGDLVGSPTRIVEALARVA